MSVIRSFAKFGIRVPEDVYVVVADDIPFAALTQPPLTTIRIPREQLGFVAMQTLHEMLTKPAKTGTESILETELVIRESTATILAELRRPAIDQVAPTERGEDSYCRCDVYEFQSFRRLVAWQNGLPDRATTNRGFECALGQYAEEVESVHPEYTHS